MSTWDHLFKAFGLISYALLIFHTILNLMFGFKENVLSFDWIITMSKKEIVEQIGLFYNDVNGNVWRYNLKLPLGILRPRYIYLVFKDQKVVAYYVSWFKTQKFHDLFDNFNSNAPKKLKYE